MCLRVSIPFRPQHCTLCKAHALEFVSVPRMWWYLHGQAMPPSPTCLCRVLVVLDTSATALIFVLGGHFFFIIAGCTIRSSCQYDLVGSFFYDSCSRRRMLLGVTPPTSLTNNREMLPPETTCGKFIVALCWPRVDEWRNVWSIRNRWICVT